MCVCSQAELCGTTQGLAVPLDTSEGAVIMSPSKLPEVGSRRNAISATDNTVCAWTTATGSEIPSGAESQGDGRLKVRCLGSSSWGVAGHADHIPDRRIF